ncbi:unnamed protein product [Chironomus riparius]|uniref:Uncharacterized protein n=1 Tax=Chironomus riparius TaxID=315576 RepID=A0A9N9SAW8_9DIPT|nr:unnamed protein product [Chironomus riparius]
MKIELIVFIVINVLSNDASSSTEMANIKETFRQFISKTRVQVSESVSQINEVLHNHNNEAAKYLIHARDSANGIKMNVVSELNEEIDSTISTENNDDEEIQEMAEQPFISLEQLASVATKECVIKHWNDYIQDVTKAFKDAIIYVPRCYEKHNVLENAIAIHKKIEDGIPISDELLLFKLSIISAQSEIKDQLRRALESAEIEHLFTVQVEDC